MAQGCPWDPTHSGSGERKPHPQSNVRKAENPWRTETCSNARSEHAPASRTVLEMRPKKEGQREEEKEGGTEQGEKAACALSTFHLHLLFLFAQTSLWWRLSASGLCSKRFLLKETFLTASPPVGPFTSACPLQTIIIIHLVLFLCLLHHYLSPAHTM